MQATTFDFMNTSERVHLIQGIAKAASTRGNAQVDLTLRQFGFRTFSRENWGDEAYVIAVIEDGMEDDLSALAKHFQQPPPSVSPTAECWKKGYFRLFISHLASDKIFATGVRTALEESYVSGFVAHVDIEPTKEWRDEIESALFSADALIAILTSGFHESQWTDQEVGVALGRKLLVLPIRAGKDPYGLFGKFQALNGSSKNAGQIASDIVAVLRTNPRTATAFAEAVVTGFENTWQWERARRDIGLLESFDTLSAEHIRRIDLAAKNVTKIQESWGVVERVQRLVARSA